MSTTPHPGAAPSSEAAHPQPADNHGRDARGRFAAGNPGGPGNPFARRVAELRSVLLECVTKEDMQFITCQLVEMARTGDLAAIKLLFQYVVGKPAATVDPDSLDYQEMELYRQAPTPEEFHEVTSERVPPAALVEMLRYSLPCKDQQMREVLVGGLRRMDEAQSAGQTMDMEEIVADAVDEVLGRTNDDEQGYDAYEQPQSAPAPSTNGEMNDDPRPTLPPLPLEKSRTGPAAPVTSRNGKHLTPDT